MQQKITKPIIITMLLIKKKKSLQYCPEKWQIMVIFKALNFQFRDKIKEIKFQQGSNKMHKLFNINNRTVSVLISQIRHI